MPESSSNNPNGLILDAAAITEFAMRTGFKKTHMTLTKTSLLAVLAGIYVAFGCQTMIAAMVEMTFSGPAKLLGGSFFSTALMVIVLCGAELFTGNVLIFIAVLSKRVYMWEYIYDLLLVYFSNMAGAVSFGILFWGSGVNGFEGEYSHSGEVACKIAVSKSTLPEYQAFLRGIGANMCVCFSILMAYASKTVSGKILACIFPIAAFVAMGFEHSVANMYLFTAATLLRCPGFKQTDLWGELFLCTAGNLLGAMFLALVYWYVNIHGTKLELPEVPHEVTTCCECGASTTTKSVATTGDDAARTTIPPPEQQQNPHSHHHHHQETGGYFTHSCANTSFSAAVAAAPTATPTNFDGRGSQQVQGEPLVMSNNLPHTSSAGSTYGTEPFPK